MITRVAFIRKFGQNRIWQKHFLQAQHAAPAIGNLLSAANFASSSVIENIKVKKSSHRHSELLYFYYIGLGHIID